MNKFIGIGRITKDLELKEKGETKYINFSIAIERGGKDKESDFINCVAFNKTAEFINQYMSKGLRVAVEGRLKVDTFEKDGQKRTSTYVVCEKVYFADGKKTETKKEEQEDDFLPFD